ncbi:peptide chain release factor N(5)-glutamine methyltransferase [Paenibacillus sp. TRM 82003]|uniref:peptide chain release factor N(5)-glutamine methyltransferase n=1 Tax=Kineococcus sp. TRM81007 TaxID=2925831 RepID=UPI001F57851C|nr:peptide chain release factor N(5)-glutamine methyltransferase [Kineococcus sp. TRM81007]MCI2239297.1 peptide chain release factor N(5)-glutamine methyltransferase [Kineococcus sp. TRM81007]MCI3924981.1 peptide chain release factor N(5)-glutamine methyltransferase [Paenibacillus sp. TRM 82003]
MNAPASGRTVRELVGRAEAELAAAGVQSPRVDAEVLLAHALGVERSRLGVLAALGSPVEPGPFADLVAQRAQRVPLQHLTGRAPFRSLELAVGPGVFVPRPETELVAQFAVDEAARLAASGARPVVVDLCTGSGAIALAVAVEVPAARVHAVELDPMAHAWARRNADDLGPGLDLRLGDAASAFGDLDGEVDVVVSNPPYVPPGAVPQEVEVARHDPELALYGGGEDGLQVPRRVVAAAARLLRPGGLVVVEHAEVQEDGARRLLAGPAWRQVEGHRDLTGRPRCTSARRT